MLKFILSVSGIFCFYVFTLGQTFGGNPWNLKWQQLESENLRIIFPEGYEDKARRVYSLLTFLETYKRETIGDKTDPISIVLNNRTTISNGYVGLAPFRSEFFSNPFQNNFELGATPWLDLLSIHEYRHILQFSNARQGISKWMSILFGQAAFAGALNLAVPDWYLEGDAVMAETAMTNQGRGRIPAFMRGYKAYELAGQRFSYQKVRNGSFKDFLPDHYRLGYIVNRYATERYGDTFWAGVLADAGKYKGLIRPFSNAIKRRTGLSTSDIYHIAFDDYKANFTASLPKSATTAELVIPHNHRAFTNYRLPRKTSDGALYYLRSGLRDIPEVYLSKDGKTSKITSLGQGTDLYYDQSDDKIVWSELRFNPIRTNVNHSVIMLYDVQKKEKLQLTQGSRLFSPAIHSDGKVLAAVHVDINSNSRLEIFSTRDGLMVDSLVNNTGYFITYPQWSPDGKNIYFAARDEDGRMAICGQNVESHDIKVISPWRFYSIGVPRVTEDHVYYSQSDDKAEHIYRVNISDGSEELIVESTLGAYSPEIVEDKVVYAGYTKDGMRIMQSDINPIKIEPNSSPVSDKTYDVYGSDVADEFSISDAPAQKYGRISHPVNIHSWGFTADDNLVSFAIESENILNSITLNGGLQYIFNDDRLIYTAGARFGFTYPFLDATYSLEQRSFTAQDPMTQETFEINFNEHTVGLGATAPLVLSSGIYARILQPRFSLQTIYVRGDLINQNIFSNQLGVSFLNRRITAPQNVIAPWSQWVSISQRSILNEFTGSQFDVETEFSFPGLLKNHALRVEFDYAKQASNPDFTFGNRFDFARGYPSVGYVQANRIGLNYHLPLFYPEFGINGIIFLQRLQANLFYDQSTISTLQQDVNLNTLGGEILFDCRMLNSLSFSFGLRYAYLQNANAFQAPLDEHQFEFFIPFFRF